MRVYTVVCNYILDGAIIKIELSRMLKRLNIEKRELIDEETGKDYGTDYGLDDVIRYNISKGYKVKYDIQVKIVKEIKELFEYAQINNNLISFVNSLNYKHGNILSNMSDEEFIKIYKNYGNDYTKQTKRR